ncbi:MAG: hypothetical protein OEV78_01735 [Spirochaetia bacterium]|nr:hypothetical protein [Spirochaetia bacterium]
MKNNSQVLSKIGWILFGLMVVLIPLWIVFFVYILGIIVIVVMLFFIKEFLYKIIKSKNK